MKAALSIVIAVCLTSQLVLAASQNPMTVKSHSNAIMRSSRDGSVSFCSTCIDFADNALNFLLNAVLNLGIVGSCGALCQYVESKTGQIIGTVCNLLCDIVGIDEFVKVIEKADLDPIYYCELLKACPINDHGDANITSLTVSPGSGPQGAFTISLSYTSKNGTGTGEIAIDIKTVDGIPLGDSFLNVAQPPGSYIDTINLNAKPDPDCDPSQGPCEQWLPGVYQVEMAVCNGQCGSKHPHSSIYSIAKTSFTITP